MMFLFCPSFQGGYGQGCGFFLLMGWLGMVVADLRKLDAAGLHEGDKGNVLLDGVYPVLIDHLDLFVKSLNTSCMACLTYGAYRINTNNMSYTKRVFMHRHYSYPVEKEVSIESLGSKIKQLRQEKGWPQDELAFHARIDGWQISRYENDKVTPSVEVVVKLAKAFDVSVDHLLFDNAPKRPLYEPASKLTEKIMHLEDMSEEDEASLLHILKAIETKNKLMSLMKEIQ